jgi:hypothetical protein
VPVKPPAQPQVQPTFPPANPAQIPDQLVLHNPEPAPVAKPSALPVPDTPHQHNL